MMKKLKETQSWALTSGTGTAGGGATGEWLWGAGFLSDDRPHPPATPRCLPVAGGRVVGHLSAFASVSQSLIGQENGEKDMIIKRKSYWSEMKALSIFAEFLLLYTHVSFLKWSTCLEPSSVATCYSELVAPFGITHVWHKSVVECITWEKETLINSNATEKIVRSEHNLEHRIGKKNIYS